MDPVKVAFELSSSPAAATVLSSPGRCARCATLGRLTPTRQVVSATFTGFDAWHGPAGGLCPACVWLYSTNSLRMLPHLVSQTPAFAAVTRTDVLALLIQGPLRPACALSVPLRPGRKHLFADLLWGTVRTDNANLRWTSADASHLGSLQQLRVLGFGAGDIRQPAPSHQVLRRQPAELWDPIQRMWRELDPWRATTHWLALGLAIT